MASPSNLIEIRCPFNRLSKKNGKTYPCNHLCVRVTPGSAGEAHCDSCKRSFPFDVTASD